MAFPTTSVLDNFNRADGLGLGANWTNDTIGGGATVFTIASNQCRIVSSAYGESYWNSSTPGPDSEAYITVPTLPSGAGACFGFTIRMVSPGSAAADGYRLQIQGNDISIIEVLNGGETVLGATITHTLAAGDAFGIEVIGSTITAYKKIGAGAWSSVGNRSDGTYTAAGRIGMWMYDPGATGRMDDFSGGTVVAAGVTVKQLAAMGVG